MSDLDLIAGLIGVWLGGFIVGCGFTSLYWYWRVKE